jgi:biotin carboxylase
MARCLEELDITGIPTNKELQKQIVDNPHFKRGELSTDFLERRLS